MSVGWGILGCGWIAADKIAPAIQEARRGKLVSFLSRDLGKAESLCRRFGASHPHNEIARFLSDPEIDAVFIATPNGQHAREAILAAEAGKHVLVEKPMATSSKDASAMISASQKHGVKLSVGYHMRFHPAHAEAARLVQSGDLGPVTFARSQLYFRYPGPPPSWRQSPAGSGWWALGDVGTHALDLLCWLLGEVTEVAALFGNMRFDYPTEETAALLLRFKGGAIATLDCSTGTHSPSSRLEVYGLEGHLIGENTLGMAATGTLRIGGNDGNTRDLAYSLVNPYAAEIEAFNLAILEGRDPYISGDEGAKNVAILEAAAISAREKRVVKVGT